MISDQKAPLVALLLHPCQPPVTLHLLLYSFISSALPLLLFFALQPFLTGLQRRQWIVFNEQRDVEQRSQRDRATQTTTQFPSLIHYLHADFHLCHEDFYFEVSFIFHVPKRRVAAFILTKDICVSSMVEEFSVHQRSRLWGENQFMQLTLRVSSKRTRKQLLHTWTTIIH